jgi:hypothetical protein
MCSNGGRGISPENLSVFAGHYSGYGRGGVDIMPVQLQDTEAFFAGIDARHFSGVSTYEIGASLYWMKGDYVFILTILPLQPEGVVDFDTMLKIANSIRVN